MKKLNDLTIEIIQKCPNFCMHCSSLSSLNSKTLINKESVLNVANQAIDLGLTRLVISGGEPLYHPDIKSIVHGIVDTGLDVSIYTTGIAPDAMGQPSSFHDWNDFNKNTRLIFSVHSTNDFTHDEISGRQGALSLTKSSVFAAKEHDFYTEVHLVPNKINLFEIEETVDTLASWGVDQVSFLRLVPQGYAYKNRRQLSFNSQEIKYFTSLISKLCEKDVGDTSMRFGIPFSQSLKHQVKCNAGENKLIIRYDGKVLPCEAFKDAKFSNFILGDIYTDKLNKIMDIGCGHKALNSSKMKTSFCEACPAQVEYKAIA
jgi:radical SAM protein with 4Fe4S-binding SPASM domain